MVMESSDLNESGPLLGHPQMKQNKNNTEASGQVGSAMRIIVWMNYCEIKAYVSPSKISVTSHRMNN